MFRRLGLGTIALALLLLAAAGISFLELYRGSEQLHWNRGELGAAEGVYYGQQAQRVGEDWQQIMELAPMDPPSGTLQDPHRTCLCISPADHRIWVEYAGQIVSQADLGPGVTWRLQHCTPQATNELPGITRLKMRGHHTRRLPEEKFRLLAQGAKGYVALEIDTYNFRADYGTAVVNPVQFDSSRNKSAQEETKYPSMLVTEAEYQQDQQALLAGEKTLAPSGSQADLQGFWPPNRAEWLKVEREAFEQIDRHVTQAGYEIWSLRPTVGPAYRAAQAEISARRAGRTLFGRSSAKMSIYFDYIGDGVWYAKSGPRARFLHLPRPPRQALEVPDIEFLLGSQELTGPRREEFLTQGREIDRNPSTPPSPWQVNLPNGATVEFIGVCDSPCGEKPWWGPDGSALQQGPYVSYRRSRWNMADTRRRYDIAWKVVSPPGGGGTTSRVAANSGSSYFSVDDKYGNHSHAARGHAYLLDASRETTDVQIGAKTNDGDYQWVLFQNVSLRPGKNAGFQIITGDQAKPKDR